MKGDFKDPHLVAGNTCGTNNFLFRKFSFHEFCLKITYELILYAKLNESGSWNEVSCSKKDSQMNDFYLKLKLTSICFTHTSAIVTDQYDICCCIARKCGGLSLAWLLAFTKSFAALDIRVFGLLSIKKTTTTTTTWLTRDANDFDPEAV